MPNIKSLKNFFFGEQSLRQTVFKNSFWLTVSNVGSSLLKAVIVIYAARLLGASEYGFFSYAISIAATFTILSDLGLNYLITINLVRKDEAHEAYFSTLMALRMGLLVAIIALTIVAGPFLTKFPEAKVLIPLVALLFAADDMRGLLNTAARAENRMDKEAFGYIVTNLLILALCLIGLQYSYTSYMLTLMYLIGSVAGTFLVFLAVRKNIKVIFHSFRFNLRLAKEILIEAIPYGFATAMWAFMINTDMLLVGWFRSATELGYYAAAQRPITILFIIPGVLFASSFTIVGRLAKEGASDRLKVLTERLIVFTLAVVLPIAVGGIIIAPSIINFLYGSAYAPAVLSFELLFLTLVISYPASIVSTLVLAHKQRRIYTFAMVAGAIGNVIFDLILIPRFGISGSVVATIIALTIINGYMWYEAKKIQPFTTLPFLPRIMIATLGMGIVTLLLHFISINFFLNIVISAIVYMGLLIIMREPLLKEIKELIPRSNTKTENLSS